MRSLSLGDEAHRNQSRRLATAGKARSGRKALLQDQMNRMPLRAVRRTLDSGHLETSHVSIPRRGMTLPAQLTGHSGNQVAGRIE